MVKMGLHFEYHQLETIDDVKQALELLNHNLPATHLEYLQNFNTAYLIITKNVRNHVRKGDFRDPDFLAKFDTVFARYYFAALEMYETGQAPPAWHKAFIAAKQKKKSPLVCMALGVNAHVNNDIPQVLCETNARVQHFKDFLYVNKVIEESIFEVIDSLDDDNSMTNPKYPFHKPVYKFVMKLLIKNWRYNAWRMYQKIKYSPDSKADIELSAARTAAWINRLPV